MSIQEPSGKEPVGGAEPAGMIPDKGKPADESSVVSAGRKFTTKGGADLEGVDEKTIRLANDFVQRFRGGIGTSKRVTETADRYPTVGSSASYSVEKKGGHDVVLSIANVFTGLKEVGLTPEEVISFAKMEEEEQAEEATRKAEPSRVEERVAAPKPKHEMIRYEGKITTTASVSKERVERFKRGLEQHFQDSYKEIPNIEIRESRSNPGKFRIWIKPADLARLEAKREVLHDAETVSAEVEGEDLVVETRSYFSAEGKVKKESIKSGSDTYDMLVRRALEGMNRQYIEFD